MQAKDSIIKKLQTHIETDREGPALQEILGQEDVLKQKVEEKENLIANAIEMGEELDTEALSTGVHLSPMNL